MNTVLFVNTTIGFSENLFLVDKIDTHSYGGFSRYTKHVFIGKNQQSAPSKTVAFLIILL